jgi:hypothetical protein
MEENEETIEEGLVRATDESLAAIENIQNPLVQALVERFVAKEQRFVRALDDESFGALWDFLATFYSGLEIAWRKMDRILGRLILQACVKEQAALMVGLEVETTHDVESAFTPFFKILQERQMGRRAVSTNEPEGGTDLE